MTEKALYPVTIGLDYDDTFTADPELWRKFVVLAQSRGHRVVCVSARRNTFDNLVEVREAMPSGVDVYLSYDAPKRLYAESQNVYVDIWIDDMPDAIENEA